MKQALNNLRIMREHLHEMDKQTIQDNLDLLISQFERRLLQIELLDLLQEECSEVIQIASKIKRFGLKSYHPDNPSQDNQELIHRELGDVNSIITLLEDENVLDDNLIVGYGAEKYNKLKEIFKRKYKSCL